MKKRRVDYSIRFQPFVGTPEEKVLNYLRHHQLSSVNTLIMQAIRPYWLPLVLLEDDVIPLNVKQQLGRDAVRELLLHADYICSSLGLERFYNHGNLTQSSESNKVKAEKNSNVYHKNETKLVGQLEVEIGNGEWGSLGSFSE
ncbi:MAG: hypothetical protein HC874_16825 [Richelia sp. SL_2_1]|nr:hypothetical protein [Richelia sp. SM1_7_0]NJN13624.1 hypothetical protein [Richelia sp. RM1_1_1]NJO29021.1 hypothetical protein [Richelia sp. SL_2_1]